MRCAAHADDGFTLIEVVVAIAVLAIGILALAGAAAATVRSMADSDRIREAARAAETERERASATTCAAAAGVDSVHGARIVWTASPGGAMLSMNQTISLPRSAPVTIAAAEACR